jgi:hypothetical protein
MTDLDPGRVGEAIVLVGLACLAIGFIAGLLWRKRQ